MIKYKQGDLLKAFEEGEVNVLIHQENCQGLNYFAGFAKVLHKKYPKLTEIHVNRYKELCGKDGKLYMCNELFSFPLFYTVSDTQCIVNLYAQLYRGQPSNKFMHGTDWVDYDAKDRNKKIYVADHDSSNFPHIEDSKDSIESKYAIGNKIFDTFENRCYALRCALKEAANMIDKSYKIGLPLIASGLAADKELKYKYALAINPDLQYFKKYIAPIVEEEFKDLDVTVYYL
jgi:hypothetical protein